jgi:hypothetical protein
MYIKINQRNITHLSIFNFFSKQLATLVVDRPSNHLQTVASKIHMCPLCFSDRQHHSQVQWVAIRITYKKWAWPREFAMPSWRIFGDGGYVICCGTVMQTVYQSIIFNKQAGFNFLQVIWMTAHWIHPWSYILPVSTGTYGYWLQPVSDGLLFLDYWMAQINGITNG